MLSFDDTRRADRREYSDLHKMADRLLAVFSNERQIRVICSSKAELAEYHAAYDALALWLHVHCRDCGAEIEGGDLWCSSCVMAKLG